MFHVGWRGERRVYGCVIHIDIKEDKIWIQRDGTEVGIANESCNRSRSDPAGYCFRVQVSLYA